MSTLFSNDDLSKIGRTLLKSTPDTLILELTLLNMELTSTAKSQLVGQQIDKAARHQANATVTHPSDEIKDRVDKARLSRRNLNQLKLE